MSLSNLKNWPVLSFLEKDFITEIHMVAVFGDQGNEALIVTKNNAVYALGTNSCGCLGLGNEHSTLYPKLVTALCNKDVISIAYGSGPHVLALTEKGTVYSWGHNGYCELGNETTYHGLEPTIVQGLNDKIVIEIACGNHHSVALTNEGEIYAWGQNNCGQLGYGVNTSQDSPRRVNTGIAGKKVVSIACGQSHTVAVIDNGDVYGWGYNGIGQLGIGNYSTQVNPTKVSGLVGVAIEKVACGHSHTLALSTDCGLYAWGANSLGQLGLGNKINSCNPVKVSVNEMGRVLDIASLHCSHISAAIGEGGRVFIWGQCRGQNVTSPVLTNLINLQDAFAFFAYPTVMHRPLILDNIGEVGILDCLKQAFDDPATSDLAFQVQGKPIHVHKAVLKIRSQYFRTMFQDHWRENNQSVIEHDQFSYEVYKAFLKYLYTEEVDLPPENALELMDLANIYCEAQLKKRCVMMIKQGVTVTNTAFLYNTAVRYDSQELEEFCFKFALNHMTAVILTPGFAKLDESTIKTFLIKAAQAGAFKT